MNAYGMKTNPLKKGAIPKNSEGIGTVSHSNVLPRAAEIAVMNGRSPHKVLAYDSEQARRELMGGQEMDPKEADLESVPETERWDPVPGSEGHKVPGAPADDEDSEGRSDEELAVEEGMAEAEYERMVEATEAERRTSRRKRYRRRS